MSMDPQYDRVITLEPAPNGHEPVLPEAVEVPVEQVPQVEPIPAPAAPTPKASRPRPRWILAAAVAAVGLVASGTLGYLLYTTNTRLDATQETLAGTRLELANLKTDAATKKQVADYVSMYTVNAGKVRTDYEQVVACNTYSECRTAAQQTLSDMQAFQSDRETAKVPAGLSASDSQLGDSLSAGIAALHELISGMDNDDSKKVDSGFIHLNDAMLGVAKAESVLGAELR